MDDLTEEKRNWVIFTDAQLTRRKRYHCVITPKGDYVFKSRDLWDCFEYLHAEQVTIWHLLPMRLKPNYAVNEVTVTKEPAKWQN